MLHNNNSLKINPAIKPKIRIAEERPVSICGVIPLKPQIFLKHSLN